MRETKTLWGIRNRDKTEFCAKNRVGIENFDTFLFENRAHKTQIVKDFFSEVSIRFRMSVSMETEARNMLVRIWVALVSSGRDFSKRKSVKTELGHEVDLYRKNVLLN